MFGMGKHERAVYERLITTLADEVDWLRAQLQMIPPSRTFGTDPTAELEDVFAKVGRLYLDEDEEMIAEELRDGSLSVAQAEQLLEQVGALNREIQFADAE
jgi:hypothetical protein